jgi:hypothetical protein
MKKALLVVGVLVLAAAAFFAGRWTAPGPMMFTGGPGPNAGAGQIDRPFQVQGLGETFTGEISSVEDGRFSITGDEERAFEIDANTRLTTFGSMEGLKLGDIVEVVYEADSNVAISITVMNYFGE